LPSSADVLIFKDDSLEERLSTQSLSYRRFTFTYGKVANLYWHIDATTFGFAARHWSRYAQQNLGAPPCTKVICFDRLGKCRWHAQRQEC